MPTTSWQSKHPDFGSVWDTVLDIVILWRKVVLLLAVVIMRDELSFLIWPSVM